MFQKKSEVFENSRKQIILDAHTYYNIDAHGYKKSLGRRGETRV